MGTLIMLRKSTFIHDLTSIFCWSLKEKNHQRKNERIIIVWTKPYTRQFDTWSKHHSSAPFMLFFMLYYNTGVKYRPFTGATNEMLQSRSVSLIVKLWFKCTFPSVGCYEINCKESKVKNIAKISIIDITS